MSPTPECREKKPFHIPIRIALFDTEGQSLPLEEEILELRETQQTFKFTGLAGKPIVSLLRDFSAPVKLERKLSQDELLALLQFESDGYAKWDAAQCLALACIIGYCTSPSDKWHIPQPLLAAYHHVLQDESLDYSLRAELLTPPEFEDVAASLAVVEVDAIEKARDYFRDELGKQLFAPLHTMYQTLWQEEDHGMYAEAYGKRKLRNICLWLLMCGDEARSLSSCQQQFSKAKTMTDQIASFDALVNCCQSNAREQAIDSFYRQWSHDELVLDKWFSIQACCELPGTLARVRTLLQHPAFSIRNPNKVRSLIGAFCQGNPRHFHAIDGSGYVFLGEMLIKIDKINPQIAARLATPFTRWSRFDPVRQKLMKQQLKQLAGLDLSRDLGELVEKSL